MTDLRLNLEKTQRSFSLLESPLNPQHSPTDGSPTPPPGSPLIFEPRPQLNVLIPQAFIPCPFSSQEMGSCTSDFSPSPSSSQSTQCNSATVSIASESPEVALLYPIHGSAVPSFYLQPPPTLSATVPDPSYRFPPEPTLTKHDPDCENSNMSTPFISPGSKRLRSPVVSEGHHTLCIRTRSSKATTAALSNSITGSQVPLSESVRTPHPYSRIYAKQKDHRPAKRRKMWNHALEKHIFTPEELASIGAPQRRTVYTASLEAHVDKLHARLLEFNLYPVSFDFLEPYRGLNTKTAKSMVAGLQKDYTEMKTKELELERANSFLEKLDARNNDAGVGSLSVGTASTMRRHSVDNPSGSYPNLFARGPL